MKNFLPLRQLLPVFLSALLPAAAVAQNCVQGAAKESVESGNIRAMVMNGGDMFWDLANAKFEVPKGSGKHSIFAGAIWLGGVEAGTNYLHLTSQTYRQPINGIQQRGYWPGPIGPGGTPSASDCAINDRFWLVTSQQVQDHIANYANPNYIMPAGISTWPGSGNAPTPGNGSNVPFVDANNNGLYEPQLGDYPAILGDEAAYIIMNDMGNIKQPSTPGIGLETHVMMFGFNNPGNTAINNTIFARYTFINRGNKTLNDTYFGKWVDFDIGNYQDDMIGSDVGRSMFYGYNGDNNDEGTAGYGLNPPAQGVLFLNAPMSNFVFYQNNSSPVNGNPNEATDFYNYMRSKWRNGNPITYGGSGIGGTTPANYMFDGDPVAGTGWNELSLGNPPGDRRGMGSHGPFTFAPGNVKVFDIAYPWARGSSNLNSITELQQSADQLRTFYNTVLSAPGDVVSVSGLQLQLFPNPTEGAVQVQLSGATAGEATFTLRDLIGRTVLQEKALLPSGQAQHRLQLQQLPQGLYLLQVQQGSSIQTVKVQKQ